MGRLGQEASQWGDAWPRCGGYGLCMLAEPQTLSPRQADCQEWGQETTWSREGLCPIYLDIRGAQREGGSVQIPQVEASLSPWP